MAHGHSPLVPDISGNSAHRLPAASQYHRGWFILMQCDDHRSPFYPLLSYSVAQQVLCTHHWGNLQQHKGRHQAGTGQTSAYSIISTPHLAPPTAGRQHSNSFIRNSFIKCQQASTEKSRAKTLGEGKSGDLLIFSSDSLLHNCLLASALKVKWNCQEESPVI